MFCLIDALSTHFVSSNFNNNRANDFGENYLKQKHAHTLKELSIGLNAFLLQTHSEQTLLLQLAQLDSHKYLSHSQQVQRTLCHAFDFVSIPICNNFTVCTKMSYFFRFSKPHKFVISHKRSTETIISCITITSHVFQDKENTFPCTRVVIEAMTRTCT